MAQVSGIEVKFSADTSNLERGIGKAQGAISGFAKGAAATLAGALSAGVFIAAGKAAINFADSVGKVAQKVGSSTKALSELNYAASLSDMTFSDLETGMRFLSKSMVNNAELFNQLGVAIQNSDGSMRSTDQVLMELANKFAGMPDGVQKTALAMELFGRSGTALIPMLNAGSAGLEQMRQRAIDLGLSISEDTAKRAEQFNDTLTDLAAVGQGAMMRLASATLPLAQAFLNVSVAGAEAMVNLGGTIQDIAPYAAIAVAGIAGFYAPAVLAGLFTTTSAIGVGLVGAIKAVGVAMLANPLGLLVGTLAAAATAAYVFRDDIKNAIGIDVVKILKDVVNTSAAFVGDVFSHLKNLMNIQAAALVGVSNSVLRGITNLANKAIDVLNMVVDAANYVSSVTGTTFEPFAKLEAPQFDNKFYDNIKTLDEFFKESGARHATDYAGSFTSGISSAFSNIKTTVFGGGNESFVPPPDLGGGGGGEGGGDKETSAVPGVAPSQEVDQFFFDRLESIREGFMSEREILQAEYTADMDLLRAHLTGKDDLDAEYKDLMRQRAEQHARDLNEIERARVESDLRSVENGLGSMAAAFQNGGKKMLKVSKVFGAAQAIVSTLVAATQAMQVGLTPAEKFAAFAAVFAKGMSAVAAIKGVSEGGGGGSGGGGGGGGRMGGGGGGGTSSAPAAATPTTTFSFTLMNDPMGFGEKFARQFIDQLNSTQRNGGQIRGVIA